MGTVPAANLRAENVTDVAEMRHVGVSWHLGRRPTSGHHRWAAVRVLIVDEQPAFRRAARRTVAFTEGFMVVESRTGEESLRAVLELTPTSS